MRIGLGGITFVLDLSGAEALMLLFLVSLTGGAFLYMKKLRKERVTRLGNFKTLRDVSGARSLGSPIILMAKIFIVTLLFLTATESMEVRASQPVTNVSFAVTVDSSQSMLMPDYEPSRLGYSKDRLQEWVTNMPFQANISVVKFAREAETMSLMTRDENEVRRAIDRIEVNLNQSGTRIDRAIKRSMEIGPNSNKRIILVTDGRNLKETEINRSISLARSTSAEIYVFDIPRNQETQQIENQLNLTIARSGLQGTLDRTETESRLRQLASTSGGEYYQIENSEFFSAALNDTYTKENKLGINSNLYILVFLSFLVIFEMLLYSKYGAL